MGFIDTLKSLNQQTNDAGNPVGVYFGTVTTGEPLSILVDQKLPLPKEALVLLKNMTFEAGDLVILLRVQGGQQYLVLGEVDTE